MSNDIHGKQRSVDRVLSDNVYNRDDVIHEEYHKGKYNESCIPVALYASFLEQ